MQVLNHDMTFRTVCRSTILAAAMVAGTPLLAVPSAAVFSAGINGTVNISGSPFSTLQSWRMETRVTAWTLPVGSGTQVSIWSIPNIYISIYNNNGGPLVRVIDFIDGPAGGSALQTSAPNTSGSDFVVRLQKDFTNSLGACAGGSPGCFILEVWNVNGSNYTLISIPLTTPRAGAAGTIQIGDSTRATGTLGFLRWYSTLLPTGGKAPFGGTGGDLADYEFNNNGNDSSSHRNNLSFTTRPSFAVAPVYPPACILPPQTTLRAGNPVTALTGANSFPLNGTNTLAAYLWQQIPGNYAATPPSALNWNDGQASLNPTVTGFVSGSYTIQLTVTDDTGQSNSCSQKYGAVATDSNGSVIISNPVHAQILGPIMAATSNPWPTYEQDATSFAALMILKLQNQAGSAPFPFIDYWNTAQPGTITVTAGSNAVVGAGTAFTTLFCQGPGNPTAPKNVNGGAAYIVPWYPMSTTLYPIQNYGRLLLRVASCTDDTHLTLTSPYATDIVIQAGSGMTYAYCDDGVTTAFGGIGGWETGAYPGNYYDNVEAFYAQYYRTGIDDYLYWARIMADRWFSYPGLDKGAPYFASLNGGYVQSVLPNRSMSMTGIFMRNADNPPFDYSPGIRWMVNYMTYNEITSVGCSATKDCPVQDVRENGYALTAIAMDALFDSDPSQVSTDLANLSILMNHKWGPNKQPNGNWVQNDVMTSSYASWNTGGTNFTATLSPGSATVLPQAGNTFNCGNFPAPPFNPPAVGSDGYPGAIWFTSTGTTLPVSNAQGDSSWYYVQCNPGGTSLTLLSWNGSSFVNANYNGTLTSGAGFEVSGLLGLGTQPFMNGILNRGFYFTNLALASSDPANAANAAAFALSNAIWTINFGINMTKQGGFNTNGLYYGRDFVNCEPVTAQYPFCDSALDGDRLLNGEGINVATIAILLNPTNLFLKNLGDLMMSAMFSCAVGSIDYDGHCVQANFAPIGGFLYGATTQHKWWGFYWGVGANWSWASARLGGLLPPVPRVVPVSLNFQGATHAVLTVLRPDGTSSQVTCTSSPCPVTIDSRQGDHLLSIKYLDPVNNVVASLNPTVIKAR